LAESERKKGEGILLKKPQEEMLFIAESCYPIWLIPWKGRRLLFDGLGVTQRTLTYGVLPEMKTFVTDMEDSAENLEAYSAALSDHAHYFKSVLRVEERTILGLITSSDFIEDFSSYLSEAEESEPSKIKNTWLSPVVDDSSIAISLNELSELKTALEKDLDNLRYSMKLLNAATRKHVDVIRESIREIKKDFNEKIEVEKSSAMEKVREIQKTYDDRITKASKNFEQQLQKLHQERAKLEKSEDRATTQIDRCEAEIETAKQRKDRAVQQRWKQEMENWRREAKTLQKSIEQLDKRIEETESEKRIEIANLRSEFGAQSENAMKNVRELEASRDAKAQLNQQKIKSLEESTSTIVAQLDNLTKQKRASLNELDKMGMNNHKKSAIAYVPFYLACFQAEAERRYVVYPPSVAGTVGVLTKLKGALGISKIKSLFQQRSKAVAKILDQVVTVIERDPVFKRDLHDVGVKANILQSEENREMVKKGLEELRREEWISENEFQTLSRSLIHA
jgi:chemotaxis protein histidine kinase CheA